MFCWDLRFVLSCDLLCSFSLFVLLLALVLLLVFFVLLGCLFRFLQIIFLCSFSFFFFFKLILVFGSFMLSMLFYVFWSILLGCFLCSFMFLDYSGSSKLFFCSFKRFWFFLYLWVLLDSLLQFLLGLFALLRLFFVLCFSVLYVPSLCMIRFGPFSFFMFFLIAFFRLGFYGILIVSGCYFLFFFRSLFRFFQVLDFRFLFRFLFSSSSQVCFVAFSLFLGFPPGSLVQVLFLFCVMFVLCYFQILFRFSFKVCTCSQNSLFMLLSIAFCFFCTCKVLLKLFRFVQILLVPFLLDLQAFFISVFSFFFGSSSGSFRVFHVLFWVLV